jgi:hypothetical protein
VEGNEAFWLTIFYFLWSEVEREVNKQPHYTLASLKAKISEIMTNTEREIVILPCQRFWSQIEAVVEASGDLIKKCVCAYKLFLKFSLKYIHPNYLFYCFLCPFALHTALNRFM